MKKPSLKEIMDAEESGDIDFLLKHQVRQVRWLYKNSNKCLMVYNEKLVRLMVHRLREQIKDTVLEFAKWQYVDESLDDGNELMVETFFRQKAAKDIMSESVISWNMKKDVEDAMKAMVKAVKEYCQCKDKKPNYPEMVWCEKCYKKIAKK